MKKLLITLGVGLAMTGVSFAQDLVCGHNLSTDPITLVVTDTVLNCANGNPADVSLSWGLTGLQTPVVASGATVTDERGVQSVCAVWMRMNCYDVTRTDWYRTQYRAMSDYWSMWK